MPPERQPAPKKTLEDVRLMYLLFLCPLCHCKALGSIPYISFKSSLNDITSSSPWGILSGRREGGVVPRSMDRVPVNVEGKGPGLICGDLTSNSEETFEGGDHRYWVGHR